MRRQYAVRFTRSWTRHVQSCYCIVPLCSCRPPALYISTRVEKKRKQSHNNSTYAIIRSHESHNYAVPYGSHLADLLHTEPSPSYPVSMEVVELCAHAMWTGPRSKEATKWKEGTKRQNIQSNTVLYISTSGMFDITPSNLILFAYNKRRALSEFDTVISVKSPIIAGGLSWLGSIDCGFRWLVTITVTIANAILIASGYLSCRQPSYRSYLLYFQVR